MGGRDTSSKSLASAEIFDPLASAFVSVGDLNVGRASQTATLLNNGQVLVTGGYDINSNVLGSAELYNPATASFALTGSLGSVRASHTAVLLNDGTVLVAGGTSLVRSGRTFIQEPIASAELYNPSSGSFSSTGSMTHARIYQTETLLNNGTVLIAGGRDNSNDVFGTEVYDPVAKTFASSNGLNYVRFSHTATLLTDGTVLVAGGEGSSFSVIASAELYDPVSFTPANLTSVAVTPDPSIPMGTPQHFIATGTFRDNSTENLSSVTWTSSDSTVATITNDATNRGTAYGVASGSVTIGGCSGSVCGSVPLTVTAAALTITGLSPAAGNIGAPVIIAGTGLGATQGSSTVTFSGTQATVSLWSATAIAVTVPSGATTGNVVVTVSGSNSNGVPFTISSGPIISSLSPTLGLAGTQVTINGSGFGTSRKVPRKSTNQPTR